MTEDLNQLLKDYATALKNRDSETDKAKQLSAQEEEHRSKARDFDREASSIRDKVGNIFSYQDVYGNTPKKTLPEPKDSK